MQIKSTATKMMNTFDGLTSKLYMFKVRISDLEDILIDNSIPQKCETTIKVLIYA